MVKVSILCDHLIKSLCSAASSFCSFEPEVMLRDLTRISMHELWQISRV